MSHFIRQLGYIAVRAAGPRGADRQWLRPAIFHLITMVAGFALLSFSMKVLPLGTAYIIWTGIGAVGAFAVGILVLGESVTLMRLAAAALIVVGLVMMKLSSGP